MAEFDPSVLKEIGTDAMPDVAGSQAKALTLADLYDQNKLSKIKVKEAEQNQSDMTYARQILAGKDLTKLDQQNAAVAKITQRNPELGMQLMKSFQGGAASQADSERAQLELHNAKNDILGGAIYPLKEKHDAMIAKGMSEQQVDQAMQQDMFQTIQSLVQAKLPNGQPLLNDQDVQFIKTNFAKGYNPQAVDMMVSRSAQAKEAIALKFKQMDENRKDVEETRKDKDTAEKERHDKAGEDAARARVRAAAQGFSPEQGELLAALAERGVSLPAGFRSKSQQQAMLGGLLTRNPDMSIDELADKIKNGQISFGAVKKETQTAAGIAGRVSVAGNELKQFIPLVRQSAAKVDRGNFIPITKLMQAGQASINDPNLKQLRIYINSVLNAYDLLAARGGTDKDKRAEVRGLITTADNQEALMAGLDAFDQEARVALQAAFDATQAPEATGKSAETSSPAAAPPGGKAPPPAAGGPAAGGPGRGVSGAPPPPPGFVVQ